MAIFEGFHLPDELYYHPENHLWVRVEADQIRVGLDELAQMSAERLRHVRLKPPGRSVAAGRPFGTVEAGKYVGPLRAPVGGTLVEINEKVMQQPDLVNSDPYGEGWLVVIEPDDLETALPKLIHGPATQTWLEDSVRDYRQRGLLKE
ncbi:MAG: glycine cleavage system protein H [Anaerolineae bacterium]